MQESPDITVATAADLYNPGAGAIGALVEVDLRWSETDPLAITLAFRTGRCEWVKWVVALELVHDALLSFRPVGDGDVCMQRLHEDELRVELSSPTGYAALAFDANAVVDLVKDVEAGFPQWRALDPSVLDTWLEHVLPTAGEFRQ